MEQWRPIPGFEGMYEVSDQGRIRRVGGGRGALVGRLRKLCDHPCGYLAISLYVKNVARQFLVHRVVAMAFIGPIPDGYEVNHRDGNKKNNAATNLEIITKQDNLTHAVVTNLTPKGERNWAAKLDAATVSEIRRRYTPGGYRAGGQGYKALAKEFGVSWETVRNIVKGVTWQSAPSS